MHKKKGMLTSVICAVVLVGALFVSREEGFTGPPSYTMVCKGGSSMKAEFAMPHLYRTSGPRITISGFIGSNTSATVRQPDAGTCAWTDRGFDNDEPLYIHYGSSNPGINYVIFKAGGVERWGFNEQCMYIINAVVSGNVFYLRVYRDGNHFVATHVGP